MYPTTRSRCTSLTIGPSLVAGSDGSPGWYLAAAATASSTAWPCSDSGTSMRVQAVHVGPPLRYALATPSLTALGRSASSRTTLADLPPSSSATRLTVCAAAAAAALPARVEPVNDTMSTSGCSAN